MVVDSFVIQTIYTQPRASSSIGLFLMDEHCCGCRPPVWHDATSPWSEPGRASCGPILATLDSLLIEGLTEDEDDAFQIALTQWELLSTRVYSARPWAAAGATSLQSTSQRLQATKCFWPVQRFLSFATGRWLGWVKTGQARTGDLCNHRHPHQWCNANHACQRQIRVPYGRAPIGGSPTCQRPLDCSECCAPQHGTCYCRQTLHRCSRTNPRLAAVDETTSPLIVGPCQLIRCRIRRGAEPPVRPNQGRVASYNAHNLFPEMSRSFMSWAFPSFISIPAFPSPGWGSSNRWLLPALARWKQVPGRRLARREFLVRLRDVVRTWRVRADPSSCPEGTNFRVSCSAKRTMPSYDNAPTPENGELVPR